MYGFSCDSWIGGLFAKFNCNYFDWYGLHVIMSSILNGFNWIDWNVLNHSEQCRSKYSWFHSFEYRDCLGANKKSFFDIGLYYNFNGMTLWLSPHYNLSIVVSPYKGPVMRKFRVFVVVKLGQFGPIVGDITTLQYNATKPRAYFMGYTLHYCPFVRGPHLPPVIPLTWGQ